MIFRSFALYPTKIHLPDHCILYRRLSVLSLLAWIETTVAFRADEHRQQIAGGFPPPVPPYHHGSLRGHKFGSSYEPCFPVNHHRNLLYYRI